MILTNVFVSFPDNRDKLKLESSYYEPVSYDNSIQLGYKSHCGLKKKYECLICGTFFTNKTTIQRHVRYFCGFGHRYKCPYCDTKASCSSNIYKHVRSQHKDLKAHAIKLFISYRPQKETKI
ncbi:hypothetical protein M0802_011724 [Mischocyttarus mexicanus]|nr:hypothetical protein M0802_011724 [Mischocyttarus mexicanus]